MPESENEMFNSYDPYTVLETCTENIMQLHRAQQASNIQMSQVLTLLTQMNAQILNLSERIYRLEGDGK